MINTPELRNAQVESPEPMPSGVTLTLTVDEENTLRGMTRGARRLWAKRRARAIERALVAAVSRL